MDQLLNYWMSCDFYMADSHIKKLLRVFLDNEIKGNEIALCSQFAIGVRINKNRSTPTTLHDLNSDIGWLQKYDYRLNLYHQLDQQ